MAEESRFPWPTIILTLVAAAAIGFAVWLWLHPRTLATQGPVRMLPGETVTVTAPPEIRERVKTVTVPGPERVVTIPGPEVVKYVQVPQYIQADANELPIALAESEVKTANGDDAGTVKTAVFINRSTGRGTVVQEQTPPDFFALENRGSFGFWYGFDQRLRNTDEGDLTWSFLRAGNLHLGVKTIVDTDANLKALGGLHFDW